MHLTKKNLLLTWFLSYFLILIIPILFSLGIYAYTLNITTREANKSNNALLTQVKLTIDNQVKEAYKMLEQISLNSKVQVASNVKQRFSSNDQYNLYEIVKDLKSYKMSNEYIADAFVYFNNTNTVIGENGHMSDGLFYQLYFRNQEYDLDKFRDYMKKTHYRTMTKIHKENGKTIISFLQATLYSNLGMYPSTILVSLDESALQETLQSMKWHDENMILILDSNNQIISTTNPDLVSDSFDYIDMAANNKPVYKEFMGNHYAISIKDSEVASWKYITLTPKPILEKNARNIQVFTITGLFICLLVGAFFSYFLAKMNYSPLKSIIDVFQKQSTSDSNDEKNEYKWLEKEVRVLLEDQKNTKSKLLTNTLMLRSYSISKLLKGMYDAETIVEEMSEYNIIFHGAYNIVLLFSVKRLEDQHQGSEDYYKNLSLAKFIVMNIFEEKASDHFNLEMVDMGDFVAAIINLPEDNDKFKDLIEEIIYFVQQEVMKHFSIFLTVSVGDIYQEIDGINRSYLEASEAMEYSVLEEKQEVIYYHDIKNAQRSYYYPTEIEQKIANTIKIGNCEVAKKLINEVFEKNYVENNISADMGRCLFFDMLGTIVKVLDAEGDTKLLEEMDISKIILSKAPIENVKNRFIEFVTQVCCHISKKNEANKENIDNELSALVSGYIEENYHDPDLNVSMVGFEFNLTPAYLSRLFKEQTGESLLNYINVVRVDAAKNLLHSGLSIVEISEKVGYRSSGTFIRVFKNIVGVTPGQFKKIV